MASCDYQRQVSAYHDGELVETDAERLERHLAECPSCAEELRRLRAISSLFASETAGLQQHVPEGAMEKWRTSVRPARDRSVLRISEMLSAAAAAILLVCSTILWQQWSSSTRLPRQSSAWENAAVRTSSAPIRGLAGQLTGGPETSPDVQLANAIMGGQSRSKRTQP